MNKRHHRWKVLSLLILLAIAATLCACKQDGGNSPLQTPDSSPASVTLAPVPDEPQASNANATPDEPLTSQQQFVPGTLDPENGDYQSSSESILPSMPKTASSSAPSTPPLAEEELPIANGTERYPLITSVVTEQFGDGEQYTVSLLSGEPLESDSPDYMYEYCDMSLKISGNGIDDVVVELNLSIYRCFTPGLYIGDLTGDGTAEIVIKIPTESADGRSPLLFFIYEFVGGKLNEILSNDDVNTYSYEVNYLDNYIAKIYSKMLNQTFYAVNRNYSFYDSATGEEMDYYDQEGRVNPDIPYYYEAAIVDDLYIVNDVASQGGNSLCISQSVWGADFQDSMGEMLSFLKWDTTRGGFVLEKQSLTPFRIP